MTQIPRANIRLTPELERKLAEAARVRGRSRSELIRTAIEVYLASHADRPANPYRIAQTTEYMQLVADLLVSREMPEKRDGIMAAVAQRMEQFHGPK